MFSPNFHHQEVFRHCSFGGRFRVVVVFFYFESHTTEGPPKVGTWAIVLGQKEYTTTKTIGQTAHDMPS